MAAWPPASNRLANLPTQRHGFGSTKRGNPWAIMIGLYELAHGQPMN
jgi:hypothetical protein